MARLEEQLAGVGQRGQLVETLDGVADGIEQGVAGERDEVAPVTYVWVTMLSLLLLPGEHMNFFRACGVTFIVVGVSVLGLNK